MGCFVFRFAIIYRVNQCEDARVYQTGFDLPLPHQSQSTLTSSPRAISSIGKEPSRSSARTLLVFATVPPPSRPSTRSTGCFGAGDGTAFETFDMFGHSVRTTVLTLGRYTGLAGTFLGGSLESGSMILLIGATFRIRYDRSHRSESFALGILSTKKKSLGENQRYAFSRNGCCAFIRCVMRFFFAKENLTSRIRHRRGRQAHLANRTSTPTPPLPLVLVNFEPDGWI